MAGEDLNSQVVAALRANEGLRKTPGQSRWAMHY